MMTELTSPSTHHGNHAARLVNASRAEFLPATAPWHPPPRRTGRADRPTPQIGFVSLQTGPMRVAHNSFQHQWLRLFHPPQAHWLCFANSSIRPPPNVATAWSLIPDPCLSFHTPHCRDPGLSPDWLCFARHVGSCLPPTVSGLQPAAFSRIYDLRLSASDV